MKVWMCTKTSFYADYLLALLIYMLLFIPCMKRGRAIKNHYQLRSSNYGNSDQGPFIGNSKRRCHERFRGSQDPLRSFKEFLEISVALQRLLGAFQGGSRGGSSRSKRCFKGFHWEPGDLRGVPREPRDFQGVPGDLRGVSMVTQGVSRGFRQPQGRLWSLRAFKGIKGFFGGNLESQEHFMGVRGDLWGHLMQPNGIHL